MADPVDAATTAAANDGDDVDDLYADLDEQVAAALAAAGESGGSNARDSDPTADVEGEEVPDANAAADENEAVDLGDGSAGYSSSDEESDDGLRIVLNEDAGAPPHPAGRGEGCLAEDEDGEDSGSRVKGPSVNDGGWGKCKGLLERTVPIIGQCDRGRRHVFQSDFNFFLPRNSSIFDICIEAFQQKPWRRHGVDLTDYFNFDLDEEGWIKYWLSMKKLRQGARSLVYESSGLEHESYKLESIKITPKVANYAGFDGRNGLAKPKGRAIHVERSMCERVPSADMWRPTQRDSDVIQVNMMHSPSNQSTLDDSSMLNNKHVTAERVSINHHGGRRFKDSSGMMDRVVDKEVHDRGSSEYNGSKLYRRDSAASRDESSSSGYSDTFSEESDEDLCVKRANRRSDSRDFAEDTIPKDGQASSDIYYHSNKLDQENSGSDNRSCSYSPSPPSVRHHKSTKLLWRDEAPFAGRGRSSEPSINCKSGRHLDTPGQKVRKEHKRPNLGAGRRALFDEHDKSMDDYHSCDRKWEHKVSCSTSLRNRYHNAVHNQLTKQDYSRLERVSLRNAERYFSNESSHHHRRSTWWEFVEGEDVVDDFSAAKERQQHRDHGYHSMLKAKISNDNDEQMYKESYYREMRRARHGHSGDDEFLHYNDFSRLQSPEVEGKYSSRGRCEKSNDEHLRNHDHLVLSQANLKNSERDLPAAGLTFMSPRNRYIDENRTHNAKMVQYRYDGYHQKKKHHDSFLRLDNFQKSALCTDAVARTGRCILPVKRKLHADLGSLNRADLADLSLLKLKGRRLMHDQSVVSDREIYAVKLHKSSNEIDKEAVRCLNDMRNNITVSNICVDRRNELGKADNVLLNDRKLKFKRRGNELIRQVENDSNGRISVGSDLHSSKHKDVHQNARKQNRGNGHSGNQDMEKLTNQKRQKQNRGHGQSGNQNLEKSTYQNRQNEEDAEIEEGELIEHDHQGIVSRSGLSKPRKIVLKSVINAISNDDACSNGAAIECDDKHILEVMAKMQKRRERFKEIVVPQKEEDQDSKELSAVACSTDDIRNQRPARKRRWGGRS